MNNILLRLTRTRSKTVKPVPTLSYAKLTMSFCGALWLASCGEQAVRATEGSMPTAPTVVQGEARPTLPQRPHPKPSETPGVPQQRFPTQAAPPEPSVVQAPEVAQAPQEDPARALVENGRYLDAALLLSDLAYALPSPTKQDYLLRVVTLLLQGNYTLQADQILNQIDTQGLAADYAIKKGVLNAELLLAKQNPEGALQLLQRLSASISQSSADNQKSYYLALIDIYNHVGHFIGSAQTRAALASLLTDTDEILENQETLLRDLQNLTVKELQQLDTQTPASDFKGWVELALIAASAGDEQSARSQIDGWQSRFPGHPVNVSIVNTIVLQQPQALGRPTKIAVILPLTGNLAKPAKAIRDGFLAAFYSQANKSFLPQIAFYDEPEDASKIEEIYQRAVSDGAQFVIGPLSKQAVTTLSQSNNLSVAVLTFNYGENPNYVPPNFFQMSLSPEQEAVHVAEHAWLDGHSNAAAITPQSTWGDRVYQAFKTRWEELGGVIVEQQTYDAKASDYGVPIKRLLNLDESEDRFRSIRRLIPDKLQFEPRRRKDVDFVFMAASPRQGRLLRPQLKFHRASEIPVYSTSYVYTGSLQPDMDRDMNDVKFSDMPWTLKNDGRNGDIKNQIEKLFRGGSQQFMRLYALGIDAYQIIPELNRMRRNRFATFQGETGILYLDVTNRLQRKLLWAQFVNGQPKILAEY